MVLVEELKEADVPVREVARCDRRFDVQQVRQRLAEIAQVDSGEQGTLLLRIDGLTVGLVQPGPQRDVAAVKALKDVEADIAARQEHQGVVFFPWNTRLRPSPEGAKRLAQSAVTFRVALEARMREDQPDILTSVERFLNDWVGRRERGIDHLKKFRQALRAHLKKSA